MHQISLEDAAGRLSQLVAEAGNGEEVVLTQNNQPVARLVPVAPAVSRPRREPGSARGIILHIADGFDATPEDFQEYTG